MMMKRKEFYHLIFLRSIFVAVCLLPLFSLELKAQNSVRLTGTVKDEAGEVIIGAVVSIEGTTGSE